MSEMPCFVYVIGTLYRGQVVGPTKIGIASNPHARLRELQTGSAHKLFLSLALQVGDRADAREIERGAHECCAPEAMNGEWFDVEPLFAVATVCAEFLTTFGNCRIISFNKAPSEGVAQ